MSVYGYFPPGKLVGIFLFLCFVVCLAAYCNLNVMVPGSLLFSGYSIFVILYATNFLSLFAFKLQLTFLTFKQVFVQIKLFQP